MNSFLEKHIGDLASVVIITGHYGVGKTNFALNMAEDLSALRREVTLVDLDVVNPYFRSSDYEKRLISLGIKVIKPLYAGTSLDSPGLSPRIEGALEYAQNNSDTFLIIDVGGDEVGATALGRYAERICRCPYTMLYVVNRFRNLTRDPQSAGEILREIEAKSGLRATYVVDNSHLREETDDEIVMKGEEYALACGELCGVKVWARTLPNRLFSCPQNRNESIFLSDSLYPVRMLVKTPWE